MKVIKSYNKRAVVLTGFLLILIHYLMFCNFFPNNQGRLGHDYAFYLPALLDGFFWYHANGLFSIPWFTPAFCGGVPIFPHPANPYFSVPQFLTFIMDPLSGVRFTLIIFGALGFWGFYLFSRRILCSGMPTAFLVATLFLFNGFFSYRHVIGHLEFHSFMLIPWCAYCLLSPAQTTRAAPWKVLRSTLMAGAIISYVIYSGMGKLLVAALLSIVLLCLMSATFAAGKIDLKTVFRRCCFAGLFAIGLSISKLTAVLSFLSHVPRSNYLLPGFQNISDLMMVLSRSLFFRPAHEKADSVMANMQWALDRHEFEFGITCIPLLIIGFGCLYHLSQMHRRFSERPPNAEKILLFLICLLISTIPIALNVYSPAWNRLLKSLPILKNNSQFVRWFMVYIPPTILLTAMVVERTPILRKHRLPLSIVGIAAVIILNILPDKTFYHKQNYDPSDILQSYGQVRNHEWAPGITHIAVRVDPSGNVRLHQNNAVARGYSQLFCYDPIFGYRLESFPRKSLSPGSIWEETAGHINLKNPACYVFPNENHCAPGDHFTLQQKQAAIAFAGYRSFGFEMPLTQRIANWVSLFSLIFTVLFTAVYSGITFLKSIFPRLNLRR